MGEINKPTKRTFWNVKDEFGNIVGEGFTDINQVTTTGQPEINQSVDAIGIYAQLPSTEGTPLEEGEIYEYNGGMVTIRQTHYRTIYTPEETPALFSVYRANTEGMNWVANEPVEIGDKRSYLGVTYQCIQSHTTQTGWKPINVPALWKEFIIVVEFPEWVQPTGAHDAYNIGDKVSYNGSHYISNTAANVWAPGVYGWQLM